MTENDAPESTIARIGFLSIITSSWLPVILEVDGGFPVHVASPPWKVALFSRTHKSRYQVPIAELAERWTELPQVSGSNPGPGRFIQRLEFCSRF
ncbi:hypothetical protein TNCV_2880411 [Trichonephila clavipes]|uniref:Uncharacterized protein n=1 Tax=Trichonephila clavipes TaxID=2585209 RepID=A0A8X6W236_TRICX|nr:hypothetical protein TNCV_2880411 [Trichonephila clavipes]